MKQLISIILFSILLTAFTVHKYESSEITQMVMTLPELNSIQLQKDLEIDIKNLSGVKYFDMSLSSKTLILNYDSQKLSLNEFDHILHKWGCSQGKVSFQTIELMR